MTRIVIDGSHFLCKQATGMGSYARTLASSLAALRCEVGILYGERVRRRSYYTSLELPAQVFGNEPVRPRWGRLLTECPHWIDAAVGRRRRLRAIGVPIDSVDLSALEPPLPVCDQVLNADSLFSRAHHRFALAERFIDVELPGSWSVAHWTSPLAIKARNIPNFYTLHDLIPLRFPHFVIDKAGRDVRLHEKIAQQADHIITVSESSKRDIVELLGVADDRVSVTYQPVPSLPTLAREAAERLVRNLYGVKPGRYAIFLGAIEPKKNLKRLIEAFLVAGADIPLLLAGPLGWLYEEELDLIDTISQVGQDGAPVRRLGYLPRRHVVALLQCARLFVFPSIYEGFGLPVLEAMQLGVPVLSSRTSSLMEVAGEAAVLADPLDVSAMAHEIRRLVNDPDLRAELARRGPIQAAKFDAAGYRDRLAAAYLKAGVKIAGTPAIRKLSKWEVTNEHIEAQSPYELEHG